MSEIRFLEDFCFEGRSKSRRLNSKNSGWSTTLMDPVIHASEFEFSLKIHKFTKNLMIGLSRPYYNRSTFMGKEDEQCWVWYSTNGEKSQICGNDEDKKKNSWKDMTDQYASFRAGEVVTFYVDKKKKTIHVKKTRGDKFLLYENADLPDELAIACSRRTDPVDIELIHYEEKFGKIDYDEERWFDEKTIQFDGVCQSYGSYANFFIPLKNRILQLPKLFLLGCSKIPNLRHVGQYAGMKALSLPSLPASTTELCQLIVEYPSREKVDRILKTIDLVDYYIFCQHLGLGTGINQIRDMLSEMSFMDVFHLFKDSVVPRLESKNEVVKNWFMKNKKEKPSTFGIDFFHSAFSMQCFVEMKRKMRQLDDDNVDGDVEVMKSLLQSWDRRKSPMKYNDHEDFKKFGRDGLRSCTYHDIFCRLQRDRNYLSNITIISSDKKEFPAHREILICGYLDRFTEEKLREMISVPVDLEEVEGEGNNRKSAILEIESMEGALLRVFLDFAYQSSSAWLGNVPLSRLIVAMYHANRDRDFRLLSVLCERLEKLTQPTGTKEDVEVELRKIGHLLHNNYELSPWIIPRMMRYSDRSIQKEEILEAVKKAHSKNMVTHQVTYLTEKVKSNVVENKGLKKIVFLQKRELESCKDENQKLKERVKKMELFLKQKFGKF